MEKVRDAVREFSDWRGRCADESRRMDRELFLKIARLAQKPNPPHPAE